MIIRAFAGARRAALSFALAAAAATPSASAATSLVVGQSNATADAELAAEVGLRLGIFERHGLDVTLVNFGGGSRLIQAMTAGSIDIGMGAATGMALVAKGAPILAVCENTASLPYFAIAVPWDSPIASLKELRGKHIGSTSPGSLTDWMVEELVRKEGWRSGDVTQVTIGGDPAAVTAALREHLIDAQVGGTLDFQMMVEKKIARILSPVSAYIGRVASAAIYASTKVMRTNPGEVRAFLAAWIENTRYISSHKAETVKIESDVLGMPENVVAKEYDVDKGMFTNDCRFDAESVAALRQSFLDLKLVKKPPDMTKLYTEAYLPAE